MTDTLLSKLQSFLTPELLTRIATASGFDPKMVQGASAVAVPAILAGLARLAGSPGGAERLANAADRSSTGILDNLANRLSGNPGPLIEQGQSLMTSLLGSGATNVLTSSIAKYIGTGESSTRSLIGLLTPLILGFLGREQQSSGGNGADLARQLRAQSSEFTAALPSGLSTLLESSRFFEMPGMAAAPQMAQPGLQTATERPSPPPIRPVERTGGSWLYWAVPLVVLAGILGYLIGHSRTSREVSSTGQTVEVAGAQPVSTYLHAPVTSQSGEQVGSIDDVLITPDGRITAIVLGVERNLGLGEKRVSIPFTMIEATTRNGSRQIVFKGTKDTLSNAPQYQPPPGGTQTKQ